MAEESTTEATDTSTLEYAASLFERMDSSEDDHTDAVESQEGSTDDEQSEQLDDDAVVDEADEEEEVAPVAEPIKLKVKLPDGEVELPADEVTKGYLRQQDYTRKTQALAQETKAFQAKQAEVTAQAEQYATQLAQLADAIKQQTPTEPDWDKLQQENPDEFAATWAAWQRHTQQLKRLEDARNAAAEVVTKQRMENLKATLDTERELLVEAIPAWKDDAVATKERNEVYEYAQKSGGFSESELNQVYDHRVMVLLRKAYLYDQAQKQKPAVREKIEAVKAATPGSSVTPARRKPVNDKRTAAQQRLAKTGSVRDAAAVFELMDS